MFDSLIGSLVRIELGHGRGYPDRVCLGDTEVFSCDSSVVCLLVGGYYSRTRDGVPRIWEALQVEADYCGHFHTGRIGVRNWRTEVA